MYHIIYWGVPTIIENEFFLSYFDKYYWLCYINIGRSFDLYVIYPNKMDYQINSINIKILTSKLFVCSFYLSFLSKFQMYIIALAEISEAKW